MGLVLFSSFKKMRFICLLLLVPLGGTLVWTLVLDEMEIDAQVAPPPMGNVI